MDGQPWLLVIPISKHFPWAMSFISLELDGFPTHFLAFTIMSSYLLYV